ncbi:hypothetical protein ACFY2W_14225 [Streptomyces sp. NPDC001262]|uniref:hypothetical protein n=1 Tax=Streptomyces sp. NPDC001262 TaxID=3364552 RepID=UPI0036942FD5
MTRGARILAAPAISAITVCGGGSAAYAHAGKGTGGEDIAGSVLSVLGSSTSTGHANQCGGLLSNVAAWNATGHSNNCGNPNVAVLSDTTCITEDIHHGH